MEKAALLGKAEGTVVDSGTTMMVAKLGKKLPDDLAEAKESKVRIYGSTYSFR